MTRLRWASSRPSADKSGSAWLLHGIEQILDEAGQTGIEPCYLVARGPQDRITQVAQWADAHGRT